MNNNNYYKILEVNKYATQDEIKKSYRKLAVKYHPDKNKDDEDCKKKFQDISEAYNILGDDEKRKKYDLFGTEDNDFIFDEDPFKMFNSIFHEHLNQFKNMNYENNIDIGSVLNEMSGLNFNNLFDFPKVHVKVQSMNNNLNNILDEFNNNNNDNNNLIREVIDDIIIHENITFKEVYNKSKRKIHYNKNKFKKGKIINKKVNLEINLFDSEILLKGNGNETQNKKGNVLIHLHLNDDNFKRINEYDVLHTKEIDFKNYYKNKHVTINLPNDDIIYIKNLKGNKYIKIKKYGIPYFKDKEEYQGDLYFQLVVNMPDFDTMCNTVNDLMEEESNIDESKLEFIDYNYVNVNNIFMD